MTPPPKPSYEELESRLRAQEAASALLSFASFTRHWQYVQEARELLAPAKGKQEEAHISPRQLTLFT